MTNRLVRKPSALPLPDQPGRFERFNLTENPFPAEPMVNRESHDKRINGDIYEIALREKEYRHILDYFIEPSQNDANHLRLGYIIDTSYIGRGNGKSAFLLHLQHAINSEYCLDLSRGVNKCFAVYVAPEPGGRTKSFPVFVDRMFEAVVTSDILRGCAATLRLKAIESIYGECPVIKEMTDEEELITKLSTQQWYQENDFDFTKIARKIRENPFLQELSPTFPLFKESGYHSLFPSMVAQEDFVEHYHLLKKGQDRLVFVFSHLVRFLQAADFNGCYVLVDDFERIPDFQSTRQKRDFALELRTVLFDGAYVNARVGFFDFLLTLHAGVPRLISEGVTGIPTVSMPA